jgi:putative alpha-1,2-mannosidase
LKYAFFGSSSFAEWLFFKFDKHYVEGDAWHFRFYGTDPLKTFGSAELFVRELDRFMTQGRIDPLTVLPNPYYWAGNEPGMDAPWQFASANRSDLARHRYTTKPDGIPGNDVYGALSGWLAWAYLGFYPLYSGKTQLSVSITMFRNIALQRRATERCGLRATEQGVELQS